MLDLLLALVITWLVEWGVMACLTRRLTWSDGFSMFLINAFTNPLANAAYQWGDVSFWWVEFVVIVVEIPLLRGLIVPRWKQAIALSIVANGITAGMSWLF
jgi:hypothetical protein